MPSWPTTTDHGSPRRGRGSRRPGAGRACPATRLLGEPPQDRRRAPAGAAPRLGERFAAGCPGLERAAPPGREHVAPAALDLGPGAGPPTRPGRSRASPARAATGTGRPKRLRSAIAAAIASAVWLPSGRAASGRSRPAAPAGSGRAGERVRAGEARGDEAPGAGRRRQRRLRLALEPALDDERSIRRGGRGRGSRRARPGSAAVTRRRRSTSALAAEPDRPQVEHRLVARIASATAGGTSSSSARIMRASARGADRPRCIALMFTSASPSVWPIRPIIPGRSRWRVMSITSAGSMSSR